MLERQIDSLVLKGLGLAVSIIMLGGGAWATSINNEVRKISGMETTINFIQRDISDIRGMVQEYFGTNLRTKSRHGQ